MPLAALNTKLGYGSEPPIGLIWGKVGKVRNSVVDARELAAVAINVCFSGCGAAYLSAELREPDCCNCSIGKRDMSAVGSGRTCGGAAGQVCTTLRKQPFLKFRCFNVFNPMVWRPNIRRSETAVQRLNRERRHFAQSNRCCTAHG